MPNNQQQVKKGMRLAPDERKPSHSKPSRLLPDCGRSSIPFSSQHDTIAGNTHTHKHIYYNRRICLWFYYNRRYMFLTVHLAASTTKRKLIWKLSKKIPTNAVCEETKTKECEQISSSQITFLIWSLIKEPLRNDGEVRF